MRKFKIPFYIFSGLYLLLGITFFMLNSFSLIKSVTRQTTTLDCTGSASITLKINNKTYPCIETADLRWGHHYSWVSWQFFSNNQGYDNARYIPADAILIAIVCARIYAATRKRSILKNT